jgi:hypothetical protein
VEKAFEEDGETETEGRRNRQRIRRPRKAKRLQFKKPEKLPIPPL